MLAGFFNWWFEQLRDLLPAGWRQPWAAADMLVADARAPGLLVLRRRRRGSEALLAQARLDDPAGQANLRAALQGRKRGERLVLQLAPSQVLERVVTLPLAAERDLDRVLGYEMERLTPFAAEEVFWGCDVRERDRARLRLNISLLVVPRAAIAPLIALLAACGASPDLIETGAPDSARVIRLAHQPGARGAAGPRGALIGVTSILALLVIASPLLRQSLTIDDLAGQLAAMAPRVAHAQMLRQRIAGALSGGDAIAAETRRLGDALEALAAVTAILPDDSYLTEFTMRERRMALSGLAASAPRLISLLSADPRINNPSFSAPVTRSETDHLDVFSIRADLAP